MDLRFFWFFSFFARSDQPSRSLRKTKIMKFGLSEQQFEILNDILIQLLKKKNAKVYIFGSRARGKHHPFLDVDILFEESSEGLISDAELSKIKI